MSDTLELPNGDVVDPDDVFLYNDYPYRLVWLDSDSHAFALSPLYWGDSGMDIPCRDRGALVDQWGADSRGTLSDEEWADWLEYASEDSRFGDDEVADLADELPTEWEPPRRDSSSSGGLRDKLGL
ncbi:hypothetical protein [Haloarcula marina]|uniref:hypothetical protein n=1 Tax=Haloarcula marina TaxID=2961574 RepID=UPI0020B688D4|nr:hypothetical protein [Halomicroarcula marina]